MNLALAHKKHQRKQFVRLFAQACLNEILNSKPINDESKIQLADAGVDCSSRSSGNRDRNSNTDMQKHSLKEKSRVEARD